MRRTRLGDRYPWLSAGRHVWCVGSVDRRVGTCGAKRRACAATRTALCRADRCCTHVVHGYASQEEQSLPAITLEVSRAGPRLVADARATNLLGCARLAVPGCACRLVCAVSACARPEYTWCSSRTCDSWRTGQSTASSPRSQRGSMHHGASSDGARKWAGIPDSPTRTWRSPPAPPSRSTCPVAVMPGWPGAAGGRCRAGAGAVPRGPPGCVRRNGARHA